MNDAARRSAAAADAPRFELCAKIASGGMGSVYVARARGALGFANLVAVKRPHAHLLEAPAFKRSLFEEATLSSYVRHPNVVGIRDVVMDGPNLYLVMDYIEGASLAQLLTAAGGTQLPLGVALRIALDACVGLHAAHEAVDAGGRALGIVHRDVSPANVLVGVDGVSRISDFGIAKSMSKVVDQETTQGLLKGKLAYMAPEQVQGRPID